MNTYQIIFFVFMVLIILALIYALLTEKKRTALLNTQLSELNGQSYEDMYGRGKLSELGLMAAGIAHEISNPLSVILIKLALLMKNDRAMDREKLTNELRQIKNNAERINVIIQGMRDYIYRNEDDVEDFISLKDIISDVLVFSGQRLKSHGVELRFNNIDQVLTGHKGQYEQAILNLINNSFDAIDNLPEKWIEISAEMTDGKVKIFVKDSGQGIPNDVRKKMIEPFYSTKKGKGSGLGLTLVQGIAQRHGGELRYIEGPNTTFLLELPQASAANYHH